MSCPSSILRRDSNPQPLKCESPPITTRPGLPLLDTKTDLEALMDNQYFRILSNITNVLANTVIVLIISVFMT